MNTQTSCLKKKWRVGRPHCKSGHLDTCPLFVAFSRCCCRIEAVHAFLVAAHSSTVTRRLSCPWEWYLALTWSVQENMTHPSQCKRGELSEQSHLLTSRLPAVSTQHKPVHFSLTSFAGEERQYNARSAEDAGTELPRESMPCDSVFASLVSLRLSLSLIPTCITRFNSPFMFCNLTSCRVKLCFRADGTTYCPDSTVSTQRPPNRNNLPES